MQAICLPRKKSVVFLRGLLFRIDSSSEVLIRDDLLQGRRYQRIKHLKIREQTLLPFRGIHGVFLELFPSQDDSSQRRRNLRIKHLKIREVMPFI